MAYETGTTVQIRIFGQGLLRHGQRHGEPGFESPTVFSGTRRVNDGNDQKTGSLESRMSNAQQHGVLRCASGCSSQVDHRRGTAIWNTLCPVFGS